MQCRLFPGPAAPSRLARSRVAAPASHHDVSQSGQPPQATPVGSGSTKNMPPIAGQQRTCAGPRQDLRHRCRDDGHRPRHGIDLRGPGVNGRIPGLTIEARQGDTVTINVHK